MRKKKNKNIFSIIKKIDGSQKRIFRIFKEVFNFLNFFLLLKGSRKNKKNIFRLVEK
jgi:hypothetical protein